MIRALVRFGMRRLSNAGVRRLVARPRRRPLLPAIAAGFLLSLAATMAPAQTFLLTVSKTGGAAGTVVSSPGGINCGPACPSASASFATGTSVTLTATEASASRFMGWSGGGCSGTGTCTVTMSAARSVSAMFVLAKVITVVKAGTGSGTVTSSWSGIDCGPACPSASANFAFDSSVTLTATAASGSQFTGWSGGGCSGTGTCSIPVLNDTTVTATFTLLPGATYPLNVVKAGAGGGTVTSSPSGINCGPTCTGATTSFAAYSSVTLTAAAASGSQFTGWSGGGCAGTGTCTVVMYAPTSVTATFSQAASHPLNLLKAGSGSGTVVSSPGGINCGPACAGATTSFASGTVVMLSATPSSGSQFTGWSGGGCSGTSACTVTMNAAVSITATFSPTASPSYVLGVSKTGTGSGTVTSAPGGISCGLACSSANASFAGGTSVTLSAFAASGSGFAGWSGGGCAGMGTCTVTMSAARTVTAAFSGIAAPPTIFPMSVASNINASTATATASIRFRAQDSGQFVNAYVFALAPASLVKADDADPAMPPGIADPAEKDTPIACVLAQVNPSGQLQPATPAQLQAALSGLFTSLGATVPIVNNVPTTSVAGVTFYVGYGTSSSAMFNGGTYLQAVTVPGASVCAMLSSQTALWWNPAESGWGLNLSHQGNIVFGTLFTYDSAGLPMWLVMSAGMVQPDYVSFSGDLYRTTGPAFNAVPFTPIDSANLTRVGTMSVSFVDVNAGTLRYTVNGVEVAKVIQRQVFGSRAAACFPTTASRASATSYQDLWWNPDESGWGINLTHQDNTLFATLFTYDAGGKGLWLVMSSGLRQPDGSYLGDLYRTTGPPFNANPFTPIGPGNLATVGTMRLRFSDGEHGTLSYTYNGIPVTKAIVRQVFATTVPLCN